MEYFELFSKETEEMLDSLYLTEEDLNAFHHDMAFQSFNEFSDNDAIAFGEA